MDKDIEPAVFFFFAHLLFRSRFRYCIMHTYVTKTSAVVLGAGIPYGFYRAFLFFFSNIVHIVFTRTLCLFFVFSSNAGAFSLAAFTLFFPPDSYSSSFFFFVRTFRSVFSFWLLLLRNCLLFSLIPCFLVVIYNTPVRSFIENS